MAKLKQLLLSYLILGLAVSATMVSARPADNNTTTPSTDAQKGILSDAAEAIEYAIEDIKESFSDDVETVEAEEQPAAEVTITPNEAALRPTANPANSYFFSSDLVLSDDVRNLAYATHGVGFLKWSAKDVLIGDYDYLSGQFTLTKYLKGETGELVPNKSEEYVGLADGGTKKVRKGRSARAGASKLQEGVARVFRATTKPADLAQVRLVNLYGKCMPLWLQAKSAAEVREFIDSVNADLNAVAIDPTIRPARFKPVLVITISDDLFLNSIDDILWSDLREVFNVTTFIDADLRKYIWNVKDALCDMLRDKEAMLDINPSFAESLFEDFQSANYGFSFKRFTRGVVKSFSIEKLLVPVVTGLVIAMILKNPGSWLWKRAKNGGRRFYNVFRSKEAVHNEQMAKKQAAFDAQVAAKVQDIHIKKSAKEVYLRREQQQAHQTDDVIAERY